MALDRLCRLPILTMAAPAGAVADNGEETE